MTRPMCSEAVSYGDSVLAFSYIWLALTKNLQHKSKTRYKNHNS